MLKKKITIELAFGAIQFIFSLSAILLAIFLEFNTFEMQTLINIGSVNFYVLFLLALGSVFAISGLFLVYDWWET